MTNTSFIADTVGRKHIAEACGVGLTAVSNHVVRGSFPAAWYFPVKSLCDKAGIDCPFSLFGMKPPLPEDGAAEASVQGQPSQ